MLAVDSEVKAQASADRRRQIWIRPGRLLTPKAPKKQTTKLRLQNFEKLSINTVYCGKIKAYRANSVDPDETGYYDEPSHLDLQCLQIQLSLYLTL